MSFPKPFDLTGRVALVTGGSKGLGKAMARGLAEAGADIVISSRIRLARKRGTQAGTFMYSSGGRMSSLRRGAASKIGYCAR